MNMKKIKTFFSDQLWLGPVMLALALRLYQLTASSIWHDEGYTMWLIRYSFLEIIQRTARDVHPPAYYFFAKIWVIFFGSSVFSIRFLSLIFSLGIVYFAFKTIELIWNKKAAFWSALLIAASPFMVRFGQEARMYGVVAFFTTLATYFLAKYLKEKKTSYLLYYVPAMIVAMYTQYYAFFVIISHWLIVSYFTEGFWTLKLKKAIKDRPGVFDLSWWGANLGMFLAYLPWFPVAYRQVTRVSGSYWIKPEWITARTIPNNILQFVTYTHFDKIYHWNIFGTLAYWLVIIVLIGVGAFLLINKDKRRIGLAILTFGFLPMTLVYVLSELKTPVYQDRYFPFSAVALFAAWGIVISGVKNKTIRTIIGLLALLVLFVGNFIMHLDVNHQMKEATNIIKEQKRDSDLIISGELYTFLDGAYYLGYENLKLLSEPVDGYGESSLFYDQQGKYVINKNEVSSDRVWVLGKSGDKDYNKPENWLGWNSKVLLNEEKSNGLSVVLYTKN